MAKSAEALLPIDLELRFVLFGLECALGVLLSAPETERAFREAVEDQISAKEYVFHGSRTLSITGRVEEYEAETIWIRVEGRRDAVASLGRIVDAAGYHVGRMRRFE